MRAPCFLLAAALCAAAVPSASARSIARIVSEKGGREARSVDAFVDSIPKSASRNIGSLSALATTNFSYTVTNKTDRTLRVGRILSLCPCQTVTTSTNEIPPNGTMLLNVRLDTSKVHTEKFTRVFALRFEGVPGQMQFQYSGRTVQPFSGVPEEPVELKSETFPAVWTNRFEIGILEGIDLLPPVLATDGSLKLEVDSKLVEEDGLRKMRVEVVSSRDLAGLGSAEIRFPVKGIKWADGVVLKLRAYAGRCLSIRPTRVILTTDDEESRRTFTLKGISEEEFDSGKLAWSPAPEGLAVACEFKESRRSGRRLSLRLTVPLGCLPDVTTNDIHGIQFSYPGFAPVNVHVETSEDD